MVVASSRKVSIGLQGAGSYGAFTWGVLERLLDEPDLDIASLSGSSSGAINAVVLADGYALGGGRQGAKQALRRFWTTLGSLVALSPLRRTPADYLSGRWTMEFSPTYQSLEMLGALAGPVYEHMTSYNPLRNLLASLVDFERVRACGELELYVAATNVRSGAGRIFTRDELDVQKVLASACLPTVFAAVEVDGESYWDGSYVANPPLAPFLQRPVGDVIVVQNNPVARSSMPRSMADISNRANEIAFNISFLRELGALLHGQGVPDEQHGATMGFAQRRMHLISGVDAISHYAISSKFNAEPDFLTHLHQSGVTAADLWLREHGPDVGIRSTLDTRAVFFPESPTGEAA